MIALFQILYDTVDIAGTHGENQITGLNQLFQKLSGVAQVIGHHGSRDPIGQILGRNTIGIGFAGCKNGAQNNIVCIGKGTCKVIQQGNGAGVGVRLEDTDDPVVRQADPG